MLEVNIAGRTLFCLKRRGEEKMKKMFRVCVVPVPEFPIKKTNLSLRGSRSSKVLIVHVGMSVITTALSSIFKVSKQGLQ